MTFGSEVVVDVGVDRGELLQALHLPEPEHRALSSPERQMRVLNAIVGVTADLSLVGVAEISQSRAIGAQPVGGDRLR